MVLCIETATTLCSVALCSNDGIVSLRESSDQKSHAALLTVFIEEILKENGLQTGDLEAVAVGRGPGSYTGLRIGVSVAKGIAFASSIPLIAIDTTLSMFWGLVQKVAEPAAADPTLYCPMLDARRMEVYNAIYDRSGNLIREINAEIINSNSFMDIPEEKKIIFFGDGALKCRETIVRKNVSFADDFRISASHMQRPAYKALADKHFEDVAYFEPFYLKDFITTAPRKNVLGK